MALAKGIERAPSFGTHLFVAETAQPDLVTPGQTFEQMVATNAIAPIGHMRNSLGES
jgi:hypothetical protein